MNVIPSPDVLVMREMEPRRRRFPWRGLIISADLLIIAAVFALQHWPLFKVRAVEVEAPAEWTTRARSLAAQVVPPDSNLFTVDLDNLESRLRIEFGNAAECHARLGLPDRICVRVRPIAPLLWTESGEGIAVDGAIVVSPLGDNNAPVLRAQAISARPEPLHRAASAASIWTTLCALDNRFERSVSELQRDPELGWVLTAVDGRSKIILGWNDIEDRAARVAQFLSQSDTAIVWPCEIDARFDPQIVLRPIPMPKTADKQIKKTHTAIRQTNDLTSPTETAALPGGET